MRKIVAVKWILLAAVSGCMVGPNYERPASDLALEFSEEAKPEGEEVDLKEWWTQFNDPVLNEIIDEAIAHNYDLKIAAERISQVRAQYQLASDNLWPQINLNGSVLRQRISQNIFNSSFNKISDNATDVPTNPLGPAVENLYLIGLDASWEIDLFGRLRRLKESAYAEWEASWEMFRGAYVTLLGDVATYYSEYRSLQALIENLEIQIRVLEEALFLSQIRYAAGLRSQIEPLQTQSQRDALEAALPPLQAQMKQALYSLAVLAGREPEKIPENWSAPQPIPQAQGKIPIGLPSDLLRRRPDIRQAERKLASATALIGAAVAQLFPSFSLTGSYGYESVNASNWFTHDSSFWTIGPGLSWPVIDFGRIRDRIDFQNAAQREALFSYEQTILRALQDVESALVAYGKEAARREQLAAQVADLAESRNLIEVRYQAGLVSLSELLNSEEQLLAARQTLIGSEQALSADLMAVYKSLGGDWTCSLTP